jgi:precorrin-6Y C5,15-methyltransferase (decarboxylating)
MYAPAEDLRGRAGIQGWEGFGAKALEVIGKAGVDREYQYRHLSRFKGETGNGRLSLMLDYLGTEKLVSSPVQRPQFSASRLSAASPKSGSRSSQHQRQYAFARSRPWDDAVFVPF